MRIPEDILTTILINIRKGIRPTVIGWRITPEQYVKICSAIKAYVGSKDMGVHAEEVWAEYRKEWGYRVIIN